MTHRTRAHKRTSVDNYIALLSHIKALRTNGQPVGLVRLKRLHGVTTSLAFRHIDDLDLRDVDGTYAREVIDRVNLDKSPFTPEELPTPVANETCASCGYLLTEARKDGKPRCFLHTTRADITPASPRCSDYLSTTDLDPQTPQHTNTQTPNPMKTDLTKILRPGDTVYSLLHGATGTVAKVDPDCPGGAVILQFEDDTPVASNTFFGDGAFFTGGECMLFPDEDTRSWDGFHRFWTPAPGDTYYYIGHDLSISPDLHCDMARDKAIAAAGNCFKTLEEAALYAENIRILLTTRPLS